MSADNYFWIARRDGVWKAAMLFASHDYSPIEIERNLSRPDFTAASLEEAIRKAQAECTEYGYHVDLETAK